MPEEMNSSTEKKNVFVTDKGRYGKSFVFQVQPIFFVLDFHAWRSVGLHHSCPGTAELTELTD